MNKWFTEQQIIGFLRDAEAGVPVKDRCRRRGFGDASFHTWRARFDGMDVAGTKRPKALEQENQRPKKLPA